MQQELAGAGAPLEIRILGINEAGEEAGNATAVSGNTIPWLQDTAAQDVWEDWMVIWRDVIVLDGDNQVVAIYNLTNHDLGLQANYLALKNLLLQAAGG